MNFKTIEVKDLKKYYRIHKKEPGLVGSFKSLFSRKSQEIKAVDEISFSVEEGELVGFIGPNGAGKTTTLKCLSGLLYPTSGFVSVLGFLPHQRKPEFLRQISLIMGQKNQLWWDLPPLETFLLNKEIYEIPEDKYKETLKELVDLLEIEEILKVQVRKLSLGERMKCELVAALLHSPKVLFLDEPTIGLDVVMQKKIRDFIREYNKRHKATIILTSHYMGDIKEMCKRVIIIDKGKIMFDGSLSEIIYHYVDYKLISLVLNKEVNQEILKQIGEIKEFDYPKVVYLVPRKVIAATMSKILENLPVADLNIEEPPIEDIIRDLFTQKNYT